MVTGVTLPSLPESTTTSSIEGYYTSSVHSAGSSYKTSAKASTGSVFTTNTYGSSPQMLTCINQWSSWINTNSPIGTTGDNEQMSSEDMSDFCPGGKITKVQCVDAETGDDWESLEEADCSVESGLTCLNQPFEGIPPCRDYKIRYLCNCSGNTHASHMLIS